MTGLNLCGKKVAITGTLPIIRASFVAQLEAMGVVYKSSVTQDTDVLIVGLLQKVSYKLDRAKQLQKQGAKIIIIDGETLFPRISSNSY